VVSEAYGIEVPGDRNGCPASEQMRRMSLEYVNDR